MLVPHIQPRHLLPVPGILVLLLLAAHLHGQSAWTAKCAPALLTERRSTEPELFVVVARELAAFERRLSEVAPQAALLRSYAPAGVAVLRCPRSVLLEKILPLPELLFADLGHWTGKEERAVPGHNLFVNAIRYVHSRYPALDGSGTTISIKEFRFDTTDADLKGRVLLTGKSATGQTVHAGLMATLAAGAGNTDPEARGVAQGSRLVSSSFVGLLPDADSDYAAFDISVQNHSYGSDIENYYGAGALAYDASTQAHPDLLHVFSAGNSGLAIPPTGTYANTPGFANLTGNFKMAKNVLTVGSVDSFANVLPFSSRGPAYDGRVKPDLTAFGQNGSSEAAAFVSGAAAVVQQAFYEKYGYRPPSEMLRAILIGTCDDLGAPGPDYNSGYGNLNLKKAVELVRVQFMALDQLAEGQSRVFNLTLPPHVRRLKATLCWNDVPAPPNAARSLINDLDLSVTAPDGTTCLPWVLHPFPHRDSLLLPARQGRDSLNTVEQVTLEQLTAGTYTVRVHGAAVPTGIQAFALAFAWDTLGHFDWTSPLNNAPLTAGAEAVLRWETTLGDERGVLAWKPVGSSPWQTIDPDLPLGPGYRRWLVPDTFAAAQVRMLVAGKTFVSDTFLIAPGTRVRVGFHCPDSLQLNWTAVSPAATYRVWALGDRYLEPVLTSSDTEIVLQKKDFPQERFAVSVVYAGTSTESLTKSTADLAQTTGCYITNLLALLDEQQNHVDLSLDLGSLYGVRRVFLEKLKSGSWEILYAEPPIAAQVIYTDEVPSVGTNTYRARLEMENGGEITGDPVTVYFAGEAGYLVLPNPATAQRLAVLSRFSAETPRFFLYDVLGRLVLEKELDGARTDVPLPFLPPGCYYWAVTGEASNRLGSGSVFIGR